MNCRTRVFTRAGALMASVVVSFPVSGTAVALPAATTAPTSSADLPVLGSAVLNAKQEADGTRIVALVHGVRRIPGGTVLYLSMGLPPGAPKTRWAATNNLKVKASYPGSQLGQQQLIDLPGGKAYSVISGADGELLASPEEAWPETAGQFYTVYQVLPELPTSTTEVAVVLGNSQIIHSVAVSDGVMEPAVEQTGPLKLGEGWPKVDLDAVAGAVEVSKSISPLYTESSDLKKTVVTRVEPEKVSVDLSADVLFAVDSAKLTSAATSKIQVAADKINDGAVAGTVRVIGYTDGDGSSTYNLALSKQRAASVRKVLEPLVTLPGVELVVEGRGEQDPVASNDTSAGRQENRRVSVVFSPKESK